jgi:hypothetical protein
MLHGISSTGYLQLIDWSSRLIRRGKVNLLESVPSILSRLQTDATTWQATSHFSITHADVKACPLLTLLADPP